MDFKNKIAESLKDLKPGWFYGDGVPPNEDAINIATNLVEAGSDIYFEVFPGIEGEIQISFTFDNFELDFIINTDLSIDYFLFNQTTSEEDSKLKISFEECLDILTKIKKGDV